MHFDSSKDILSWSTGMKESWSQIQLQNQLHAVHYCWITFHFQVTQILVVFNHWIAILINSDKNTLDCQCKKHAGVCLVGTIVFSSMRRVIEPLTVSIP
jgi:hypothetical protein